MINRFPLWKYLLIATVIIVSFVYAAPNLFQPNAAVQIISDQPGQSISAAIQKQAKQALTEANIVFFDEKLDATKFTLSIVDGKQTQAKAILDDNWQINTLLA